LALERGFWDTIASTFGLNTVWNVITGVAGNIKDQFFLVLEKLLFAGTTAWNQAKPIFSQLVINLTLHTQDASQFLAAAINDLTAIIAGKGRQVTPALERGVFDFLYNLFGLSSVLDIINDLATGLKDKFINTLWEIFNGGVAVWSQATPIFASLVSNLTGHAGSAGDIINDAIAQLHAIVVSAGKRDLAQQRIDILGSLASVFGLQNVWGIISGLHNNLSETFTNILEKLLFAGTAVWNQAKPILSTLASNLIAHATDATPLLQDAVAQLQAILAGAVGKRDIAT
jgi:hypothetical protein